MHWCSLIQFLLVSLAASKSIDFKSIDGKLYANSKPFYIKGVSWFGFEETTSIVHGLWSQMTIDDALDFCKKHQFNAIRIPYAVSTVISNPIPDQGAIVSEPGIKSKTMLDVLEILISKAAERNLLVLLDAHRLRPTSGITDLWYDNQTSEEDAKLAWKILAERFCHQWNVIAAELKNEPHGTAEWGTNTAKDWRLGAERLGNAVLQYCPRWLIFVQGVQSGIQGEHSTYSGWWGGKLQGIRNHPIRISNPTKLVYTSHVYGPSVYMQPYFQHGNFPNNLQSLWDNDFGFVPSYESSTHGKIPVVLTEWGGRYEGMDKVWQNYLLKYIKEHKISSFYWCLNPNSGDTGGLLHHDWNTPEYEKLALLQGLPSTNVADLFIKSC